MNKLETAVMQGMVVSNKKVADNTYEMVIRAPDLNVANFLPGQFVCIPPLRSQDTFSRPFSIFSADADISCFSILYRVVGENTKALSLMKQKDAIRFWGPMGIFPILPANGDLDVWLVGGGIGIAPLHFFLQRFKGEAKVLYGEKTFAQLVLDPNNPNIPDIMVATEEQSVEYKGLVTDLFAQEFDRIGDQKTVVITCGPIPMMKKVAQICESKNALCYVMLERVMACGIGVCLGCSIKIKNGMKRICQDGPIFNSKEVIWDELSN